MKKSTVDNIIKELKARSDYLYKEKAYSLYQETERCLAIVRCHAKLSAKSKRKDKAV